jgi:hypothetical protein
LCLDALEQVLLDMKAPIQRGAVEATALYA